MRGKGHPKREGQAQGRARDARRRQHAALGQELCKWLNTKGARMPGVAALGSNTARRMQPVLIASPCTRWLHMHPVLTVHAPRAGCQPTARRAHGRGRVGARVRAHVVDEGLEVQVRTAFGLLSCLARVGWDSAQVRLSRLVCRCVLLPRAKCLLVSRPFECAGPCCIAGAAQGLGGAAVRPLAFLCALRCAG